ncbi:MAG TPA: ATP-binding protein [Polyangia bacterium]
MAKKPIKPRKGSQSAELERLKARFAKQQSRLREAQETLDAIRQGHVDALVVHGPQGEQVFTLKGADHLYRQLVETMNEGALMLAPDASVVYCNARIATLLKMPLERMIGVPLRRFIPPRWQHAVDALLRVVDGGTAKTEAELVDTDGEHIPVYLSATASWEQDQKLVCVIATDLSEQKRSQEIIAAERFAASIIDQAAEGILVCDLDRRVIRASQAAHLLAGGNVLLQPLEKVFPLTVSDDVGGLIGVLELALRGERISGVEATLARPGEGSIDLLLSIGPVLGGSGEPLGCVLSFVDITASKRATEERLRLLEREQAARAEAEDASRAKDEFLAMLGHELRNPLAPILTALQLMRLKGEPSFAREREVIERQVKHVVRLVDDLLDVSRITQGKVDLDRRPVELASAVVRAIEYASPLIEQRNHILSVDVAPRGLLVLADDTRLTQVVANLLTNAAKYTDPNGRIHVAGFKEDDEIVLRVSDNGVGISAEILPNLFDTFVQGRRTLDRSEGGLGLGLAIVRSLVSRHDGKVAVRSDGIGRGSEFEVRLPALPIESVDAHPPSPLPAVELLASPAHAKRVLIVDDNSDAADLMAESLGALGHLTRVAYDAPSALQVAEEFKPDVAFLDIGLPVMDGYELARRIRRSEEAVPNVRLVALTGYGQETDRKLSAAAGFDEHLVKPIDLGRLHSVIQSLTSSGKAG